MTERRPSQRHPDLLVSPGQEGTSARRAGPSRPVRVAVGAVATGALLVAGLGYGPGLLSGEPLPAPRASTTAGTDEPSADRVWTGGPTRPAGNAFVPSRSRLLRLPAT